MSIIFGWNFILGQPAAVEDFFPAFGWRNLFLEGTVTASSAQGDHPPELAFDGITATGWRTEPESGPEHWIEVELAAAAEADYAAIAAHTLAGAEVAPQYWDGAAWQGAAAAVQVPSNAPLVWTFAEQSAARWRLRVTDAPDVVAVGALHIGRATRPETGVEVGWPPPSLNEVAAYSSPISVGGQLLPRQVRRRGADMTCYLSQLPYGWARAEWAELLESAHARAFFFWLLFEGHAEVIYGGFEGAPNARFGSRNRVNISFRMRGINR